MSLIRNIGRLGPWSLVGAALALSACNDLGSGSQRSLAAHSAGDAGADGAGRRQQGLADPHPLL